MSSYDVTLMLFGEVRSEEDLIKVLDAASEAGFGIDWGDASSSEDLLEEVISSVRSAQDVHVFANDIGLAKNVRETCRNVGISYIMNFGPAGEDGYSFAYSWRPDLEEEFFCHFDGSKPLIPMAEIEKASAEGPDAVRALVWEFKDGYYPEAQALNLPSKMTAPAR